MSSRGLKDRKVLIVGAGCFGISTAYHLLKRSYSDVTVIDRATELPSPDAASSDLNKVVRSSYPDPFYARLAREAIELWKDRDEWGDHYHESGVLVLGTGFYANASYLNDAAVGARLQKFEDEPALRALFHPGVRTGNAFQGMRGYLNLDGGWAAAKDGVSHAIRKVQALGGKVLNGRAATELVTKDGRTSGVRCADGTVIEADLVVVATGSWTASTFPDLDLRERCLATGQSLVTVQLNEEEAERYRSCPVILDFPPGSCYIFPPNAQNIVKLARSIAGYENPTTQSPQAQPISTPRTVLSHGNEGLLIPKEEVKLLRRFLRDVYPELAEKPFQSTRLCWYTDSPDNDWIIDVHPADPALVIATAGSGHAYKFLPVIGQLVVDRIEGSMDTKTMKKFAMDRPIRTDAPRSDDVLKRLNTDDLCTPEDLLP